MPEYQKKGYLTQEFRIFHLKDAAFRAVPFHYHDFHKILLFLSGSADYAIEGKTYPLSPQDVVFVSAGEIHRPIVKEGVPYERIILYVAPEFLLRYQKADEDLADCFRLARKRSSVMQAPKDVCSRLLSFLDQIAEAEPGFALELYQETLLVQFMILLNRALREHEMDASHEANYDKKIQLLLRYIQEHLTEPLPIDRLAEHAFLSKYYLMRRFKAVTGYGIHRYITSKRLLLARSLLEGDAPITQICYDCGFQDYSSFSRAFRHMFHRTPAQYRENAERGYHEIENH